MDIREEGGKVVVVLRDEDIIGEHMVRSTSDELCQLVYGGARYVIVDLKETTFVGSSSVLAMFITLHKLLATAEGAFVLRNPSAQTEELLRITRLSAILDVERGEGTQF